ncbi:nucleoside diphosphate sugar epimerase [Fusarium heterosporum]|uniref:Nucleoside diphosphate sugar epimerase n=1 Tax=Fusarium heterosporum TaxID=42747 RepID=A0A8H5TWQ9_FUSHE|nr:nucleoside diphosphate sugar epimerase [Fusarium heterosporum]
MSNDTGGVNMQASEGRVTAPADVTLFQFISFQASDKSTKRLARSHAIKQALQSKRAAQKLSQQNFCIRTKEDEEKPKIYRRRAKSARALKSPLTAIAAGVIDPFQSLAVDTTRLQILLENCRARQAPEPVFTIAEELNFQNFHSVFRAGLTDPALLNAVMLSLAFAASGGVVNKECLVYQGQVIHNIRERMSSLDTAVSESTIGAILLLVGVEACLGTKSQVQLHMQAVNILLTGSQKTGASLTEGIKRAIFWQDLNSSILVGSTRIVDHNTFTELGWTRKSVDQDFFKLPLGFQIRSSLFSEEFTEIIKDIHALQQIRDVYSAGGRNVSMNVHQDPVWDEHADLLLWAICIGGAFSPTGMVRSGYDTLLHSTTLKSLKPYSWVDVYETLTTFIWSDLAFKAENQHSSLVKMTSKNVFVTGTTGYIGGDAFYALNKANPSWNYTILVRSEEKGKAVQKQYPKVKLAIGSLDDSDVIEKAASEADIVIHTAESSDHQGAARAIAAGLRSTHSSSNPGYWVHISGTGILCWYDMDNKRYGEAPLPEQSYNDLEGVDKVTSLPDTAFHRDVDKIVLEEAAKDPDAVKVAIVCPPTIYGTGRGPTNQRSRQIPGLTETALEKGFGPIIGAGETEWDNVHVHDLSNLLVLLSERAASKDTQDEQEIWGPKGYFFAENGKHKWSEISTLIAKEAQKQGAIDSDETKVLDVDEAQKKLGFQALSWGLNSRGEAKRARKYLGWKPESPSLEDWLPESVQTESKRLNKA